MLVTVISRCFINIKADYSMHCIDHPLIYVAYRKAQIIVAKAHKYIKKQAERCSVHCHIQHNET
jgi:hypothetical protein